ncbi:MAG: hypothetical protein ACOVSW_00715 [Candidatus Kapaibacteriota bacterium]
MSKTTKRPHRYSLITLTSSDKPAPKRWCDITPKPAPWALTTRKHYTSSARPAQVAIVYRAFGDEAA